MAPPICPCCGARLEPEVEVCPECGADERTGWAQSWQADTALEEEAPFDYEGYVRREFGGQAARGRWKPEGVSWFWWVVAVLLLVGLGVMGVLSVLG